VTTARAAEPTSPSVAERTPKMVRPARPAKGRKRAKPATPARKASPPKPDSHPEPVDKSPAPDKP
jgi:hypothetical protein